MIKHPPQKFFFVRGGFTIIELLVVIALISLIASIVLVRLSDTRARARDAEREQTMKSLQTALAIYDSSKGIFPPSSGAFPYGPAVLTGSDIVSLDLTGARAIPAVPSDPLNSSPYQYSYYSLNGTTYQITYSLETDSILGKDGAEGATSGNPQTASP